MLQSLGRSVGRLSGVSRLLLVVLVAFVGWASPARGQSFTPEQVPNVYVCDSLQLLSDPTGVIPAEGRRQINEALTRVRLATGVEFAAVIVPSIGERDIESFSTALFRLWGLGDRERKDGLLLVLVMDQRKMRFEVGYGLEGTLTDLEASRIQREVMIPEMRRGDYTAAVLGGVEAVGALLQGKDYQSPRRSSNPADDIHVGRLLLWVWIFFVLALAYSAVTSLQTFESRAARNPSAARGEFASHESRAGWTSLGLIVLGLPVGLLYWYWSRSALKRIRTKLYTCPRCQAGQLSELPADEARTYLTPLERLESELGSRTYHVYDCDHCHEVDLSHEDHGTHWHVCPHCGGRTAEIVRSSYVGRGAGRVRREEMHCRHCGGDSHFDRRDPDESGDLASAMLLGALLSGGSRRSGGWGGGSGGFSGGSFGGGSSGGGGATGSW